MNLILKDSVYNDLNSITNLSFKDPYVIINGHDLDWEPALFCYKIENYTFSFLWKIKWSSLGIDVSSIYFDGTYVAICAYTDGFALYEFSESGLSLIDIKYDILGSGITEYLFCIKIENIWHVTVKTGIRAYRLNGSSLESIGSFLLSSSKGYEISIISASSDNQYIYTMETWYINTTEPNLDILQYDEDTFSYTLIGTSDNIYQISLFSENNICTYNDFIYIGSYNNPTGILKFKHNKNTQILEYVETIDSGLLIWSLDIDNKNIYHTSFEKFYVRDKDNLNLVYSKEVENAEMEYVKSDGFKVLLGYKDYDLNKCYLELYEILQNIVDFSGDALSGLANLEVHFTDLSEGEPIHWEWDFGDGYTSNEQNPTHVYTKAGIYTVSLTVTFNDLTEDTKIKVDYITCFLNANFSVNTLIGYLPLTISFTDLSLGEPFSWLWDFGDGYTSNEQNPIHTYSISGNFTVVLTIFKDTFTSSTSTGITVYKLTEINKNILGSGFMRGNGPSLICD